jgi:glutathione gamma-glutamylcysteinyltransferase
MPPSLPVGGFHRRELPPPAVGFSSLKGKQLFRAADAGGGAECYFRLAEAFRTQDEPAFCGLGTLVTALNALEVDPGEVWKGSWRWYAETMLGCCLDLDEIKKTGIPWEPWCCLARCQGLGVDALRADESSIDAFRTAVVAACKGDDRVLCVAYSRQPLGAAENAAFVEHAFSCDAFSCYSIHN